MSQVVVVGGGFAGMSAAARLAKLHHDVTLIEASDRLGGALHGRWVEGRRWPLHPEQVTLPGVFRDLFRKSGRPMDRTLGFTPADGPRHIFKDGSVLDLAMGRRSEQHDALHEAFGADEWSDWVDSFGDTWEVLRRQSFDSVLTGPESFDREARRILSPRRMASRLRRRDLPDERLRKMVLDPFRHHGLDRNTTPLFLAYWHYVERTFGHWSFDGGWPGLAAALTKRLTERKVTVETGVTGVRVLRTDGRVTGVETDAGTRDAEIVVWCNPSLPVAEAPPRAIPVIPASRTLIELAEDPPELSARTWVHGNPPVQIHTAGERRWTIEHRSGENVLAALARFGLDLRDRVVERHDLRPVDLVPSMHDGWTWVGWSSMFKRPGVDPRGGFYQAGAHAHPGPRLEQIGMATAAIATHIGSARR